jgi:hypothetical protein
MKLLPLAAAAALSAVLAAPASASTFVNGGFDTGDLSGWTASPGFVQTVTSADDASGGAAPFGEHFTPKSGGDFAQLTAGVDVGVYSTLSQDFTLTEDSTVSGFAAFLAFDEQTYDDDAYVKIVKDTGEEFLFTRDIVAVGDYGHTDWTQFTSGVLGAGSYTLIAGVRNSPDDTDNLFPAQLLVDSFDIAAADTGGPTGAVPEPASWALMIAGFGLAGGALRSRRSAALRGV